MARKRKWYESPKPYKPSKYQAHPGWDVCTTESEFIEKVSKKGLLRSIEEELTGGPIKKSKKRSRKKSNNESCCCCSLVIAGALFALTTIVSGLVLIF